MPASFLVDILLFFIYNIIDIRKIETIGGKVMFEIFTSMWKDFEEFSFAAADTIKKIKEN